MSVLVDHFTETQRKILDASSVLQTSTLPLHYQDFFLILTRAMFVGIYAC